MSTGTDAEFDSGAALRTIMSQCQYLEWPRVATKVRGFFTLSGQHLEIPRDGLGRQVPHPHSLSGPRLPRGAGHVPGGHSAGSQFRPLWNRLAFPAEPKAEPLPT